MVQHTTSIQSSPSCGPPTHDPQYEYKCNHSVLYEFNRTLEEEGMGTISVGRFHSWLKQHRPYVGICPLQSDFCDKCKEYQEEIARARQVANRLKQSGHATEESIHTQEDTMAHYTALLQEHKEEAQSGLEYYRRLRSETECNYGHICIHVFGVIDHSSGKRYAYLCDERAAGPKSTDHTLTFLDHFIELYIDKWVRHLTLCLDNARICKNQYLVAWTMELVESKRFDTVRFVYLTVGHTKFAPDNLFASIAKTFYNSDVFCIEMLDHIVQQYATSLMFTPRLMKHWKKSLEQKYSTIPGITEMRDILVKSGKVYQRRVCFNGEYTPLRNYKYNPKQTLSAPSSYEPVELSAEKAARKRHLSEKNCLLAAKKPRN